MSYRLAFLVFAITLPTASAQEPITLKKLPGWVGALAWAPDNKRLAIGTGDGSISIWDAERGKKQRDLDGHRGSVSALVFATLGFEPEKSPLVSGGQDGSMLIYTFEKEEPVMTLTRRSAVLCLASFKTVLWSGSVDGFIGRWAPRDAKSYRAFGEHTSWVNSLAIDRDAKLLASGSSDNTVRLWSLETEKPLHTFHIKEGEVRSVSLSPDGKTLAAGIRYGGLKVWDVETKKLLADLHLYPDETWAVRFTPDGKALACAGGAWNKPSAVHLFRAGDWKETKMLPLTGEGLCLAISNDGRRLAAGTWDRTVRIWPLESDPK